MVVGVEDTAKPALNHLPVVPEQVSCRTPALARATITGPSPVAGLEATAPPAGPSRAARFQAVLADHHHQISPEPGAAQTLTQLGQAKPPAVGGGTALNDGLGCQSGPGHPPHRRHALLVLSRAAPLGEKMIRQAAGPRRARAASRFTSSS